MTRHRPYRPQTERISADMIRVDTCDTRRFMNPSTGISPAHCTALGHRAVVPPGHDDCGGTLPYRALAPVGAGGSPTNVHCTLYIVHCSTFTFSAKEKDTETGYSYFGARYYSSDLSIWLSVDPMAAKYASLSPYVYCANNPVKLVDPNGEEVFIYGKAKRAFFREVKSGAKALGISVKMDRFGKLSAKYNGKGPISEHGQLLLNAIKDRSVIVNIHTINNIGGTISCYMFGGAFGGNILIPQLTNGVWDYQFAIAKQTVIPSDLNILDYYYQSPGQSSLHEITEAYKGAVIAMNEKTLSSATGSNNPLFQQAHNTVIPQSGKIIKGLFDNNNNRVKDLETFRGVGFFEWQTANGELLKRTKVNFDNLEKIFN